MKNAKRPLHNVLDELTTAFVDAVLAAARTALADRDATLEEPRRVGRPAMVQRSASPVTARTKPARNVAPPTRARAGRPRRADSPTPEAATDLLITDPQALLAALDTASPEEERGGRRGDWSFEAEETVTRRSMPEILEPAPAVVPPREMVPALRAREGEQVLRSSGSSVVLRRRRA